MKTIYSPFALLFLLTINLQAQNISPYWSIAGNSNATAASKLGTVNAIPLRLMTKNLDRIRIDTFGRVGIGTTSPAQLLHVAGNGTLTGNLGIGVTSPAQKLHVAGNAAFTGFVGIGTTAPAFRLHVKGGANISQVTIDAYSAQTNAQPLIRIRNSAGADLMHIHSDNSSNIFIGVNAGKSNSLYSPTIGLSNVFIGSNAGTTNTTGNYNAAVGYYALYSNVNGYSNTASGYYSLYANTYGHGNAGFGTNAVNSNTSGIYNSGFGYASLYSNSTGNYNTACGAAALYNNNGSYNTAVGFEALRLNGESFNTALGYQALRNTTASQYNVAVGYNAGYSLNNGYNNVFLGANTDVNGIGYYNVIAIGQSTICTAPSQVTMGNPATNSYRAYANWTNISDGRYKKNSKENVPGLAFINKLRPVTYSLDATGLQEFLNKNRTSDKDVNPEAITTMNKALKEKENIVQTGFIAQEVEKSAKEIGYNFSGVDAPKNERDFYGLRYAEFVVPLVKAVQELSKKQEEIEVLKSELADLKAIVIELKNQQMGTTTVANSNGYLKQNIPNPYSSATTINYYIPGINGKGHIQITDSKGAVVKDYTVAAGEGQLNIKSGELPAGAYSYSLYVNNNKIGSRQMVITR